MINRNTCFHILISFFISGELSTEAINHDTEETLSGCATRRGKYFVHTLDIINAIGCIFTSINTSFQNVLCCGTYEKCIPEYYAFVFTLFFAAAAA